MPTVEGVHAVEYEAVVTAGRRVGLPGGDTFRAAPGLIGRTVTVVLDETIARIFHNGTEVSTHPWNHPTTGHAYAADRQPTPETNNQQLRINRQLSPGTAHWEIKPAADSDNRFIIKA